MLRDKDTFKNPEIRQYIKENSGVIDATDSGAGIGAGELVEVTANTIKTGTEQNSATAGIVRSAVAASAHTEVEWGAVPVKLGSPVAVFDELSPRADGRAAKKLAAQADIVSLTAGGNFANQPAGDDVEIVSDNAGDVQTATVYYTVTGALTVVASKTVTLTGTTFVPLGVATVQTVLGIELGSAAVGTITAREASGDLAITTISPAGTQAGVATLATTNGYGLVLRHDASGASTKNVGVVGTAPDGTETSAVDALNGVTEEDHGTVSFATVTKVLIGDVESAVNVAVLTNEVVDTNVIGMALKTSAVAGVLGEAYIKPFFM